MKTTFLYRVSFSFTDSWLAMWTHNRIAHVLHVGYLDQPSIPSDGWSEYVLSKLKEDGQYKSILLPVFRR